MIVYAPTGRYSCTRLSNLVRWVDHKAATVTQARRNSRVVHRSLYDLEREGESLERVVGIFLAPHDQMLCVAFLAVVGLLSGLIFYIA